MSFVHGKRPPSVFLLKGNYGKTGGAETLLASLLDHMDQGRFSPTFVQLRKKGTAESASLALRKTSIPGREVAWRGIAAAPLTAWTLATLCRQQTVTLLHSHDMRSHLAAYLLTRRRRIPWIAHVHGWLGPTHNARGRFYEGIDKLLVRFASIVLVGSLAAKAEVESLGIADVRLIYNGIEIPPLFPSRREVQNIRQQFNVPADSVLIGTVGRVHRGKGQFFLIHALSLLKEQGCKVYGLIVGEGPELSSLQDLAHNLRLEKTVQFTGFREEVTPYIKAMDVFVAPSLKESLPLTVLEAMALCRPVVASAVGDLPVVIQSGENGILVPAGDPQALRAALEPLMGDIGLRHRLGNCARAIVEERFSAAVMTRSVETVYEELLTTRRPSGV